MKKYHLLFLIFLLIIPLTLADITIQTSQPVYNLGNKIKASASVLQGNDFEGLFKLTISCPDEKLQYFTTPVSLEANARTALEIPEITVSSSMLGSCSLIGDLTTNDGLPVEQGISNPFEVTYALAVLTVNEKINSLPSQEIKVSGIVNEAYGHNVLKAAVKAHLGNNSYSTEALDGKFELSILLPKGIKSGKHEIELIASDSRNNMGKAAIELQVTAVPSYIKTILSDDIIDPGTRIDITSSLYDQADDLIDASLGLELASETGKKFFTKTVQSDQKIDYEFSQYAEPGLYVLTGTYQNLATTSLINVSLVRDVKIKYENQSVFIENIGNIPFTDELTFIIQNALKKYAITKEISIEPGKLLSIDLSKEVPEGIYNIMLPLKGAANSIQETAAEAFDAGEGKVLANDVQIDDNRPIYKKMASGLGSISANLVGADGVLTKNPLVAPLLLGSLILILAFKYGRKPIINLMKRKKKDDEKKD